MTSHLITSSLRIELDSDMEEPVKEPAASSGNTARPRLQKYALRSVTKSKEEKSETPNCSNLSQTKRERGVSSVSKSVSVLDFSGKGKSGSAKPPRRLSIPTKVPTTSRPKLSGNITPISESRTGRSGFGQGRSKTPISDISKTSTKTKSNLLTSASYWLNQIKFSESAAKHSISLGFFKLAFEAGCEPLGRMQEGLKSYVSRHQLNDLGETVKALFESYNISENIEQLQVSETISHVPEEGTRSSDDDAHSSSSTIGSRKLKPKSLNIDSTQVTPVAESTKKETCQKSNPGPKLRRNSSNNPNTTTPRLALDSRNNRMVKNSEKPSKQDQKGMVKRQGKKSDIVKEVLVSTPKGNKENVDAHITEEISETQVV